MENCRICRKPLKKEGRKEHYKCRMLRRFSKRPLTDLEYRIETTEFKESVKALSRNPELVFDERFR
jgi:hypothetical protein